MSEEMQKLKEELRAIADSEEYYYEELEKTFKEFNDFKISDIKIDSLIKEVEEFYKKSESKNKFLDFIDKNQENRYLLELIGKVISMCDLNASYKDKFNPYSDKRVIAKAGVRQHDWIINLLKYKKNIDVSATVKAAIEYIENPLKNLTALSQNHKEHISEKLLGKKYNKASFVKDVRHYFRNETDKYFIKNEKNINIIIGKLIYSDKYKKKWFPKTNRLSDKDTEDFTMVEKSNSKNRQAYPLNQILYGPPGTGKTYNTVNKAIEIIENRIVADDEDRKDLKAKFEEYKKAGQIEFITFHQSYGYEEFVEGIRAIPPGRDGNENTEEMIYDVVPGLFKQICEQARSIEVKKSSKYDFDDSINIWKISLGDSQNSDDQNIFDYCIKNEKILLGFGKGLDFGDCKNRKEIAEKLEDSENYSYPPTAINILKNKMKIGDIVLVSHGNKKLRAIGKIVGEYELLDNDALDVYMQDRGYVQSRSVQWLLVPSEAFPYQKVLNRQFSQMSIYDIKNNVKIDELRSLLVHSGSGEKLRNFVLIIDEINRGNISKIFGELITLIEDSKRAGGDEELKITLPYSNESFGVPNNLYIIGTMNTADRSIAPIDTALRRRFIFEEMVPKPKLLEELKVIHDGTDTGIKLDNLLEAINARIEYLYDRDHTIGHSYLMDVETLDNLRFAFKNKIIPLLAEYFYEDWENINLVLNDNGFIESKDNANYLSNITNRLSGKTIYQASDDEWEAQNFIKIYKNSVDE